MDVDSIKLSSNPKFIKLIEKLRLRRRNERGISSAEMRQRLGLS